MRYREQSVFFHMEEVPMKRISIVKRLTVATVAAAALAGSVTAAQAVTIGDGQAILAVYGNGQEYVRNLGSISNLVSNGLSLDLSSIMTTVSTGGAPVRYTLFGATGPAIFFGDQFPISDWTSTEISRHLDVTILPQALTVWGGNLGTADPNPSFFGKTDPLSFTSNLNQSGNNTLSGTTPASRPGFANLGETLYLFSKASPLAQVGIATFNDAGQFQVGAAPVPVPAAAVLFASGLVALVGLARRRMSGTRQDAA